MTTLLQQIEEMRVQVNELAGGEQKLLHALGDALTRADHQLLHDVRNVTAEHERRRRMVLKELQALALSIGSFPDQGESHRGAGAGAAQPVLGRDLICGRPDRRRRRLAPGGQQRPGRAGLPAQ